MFGFEVLGGLLFFFFIIHLLKLCEIIFRLIFLWFILLDYRIFHFIFQLLYFRYFNRLYHGLVCLQQPHYSDVWLLLAARFLAQMGVHLNENLCRADKISRFSSIGAFLDAKVTFISE